MRFRGREDQGRDWRNLYVIIFIEVDNNSKSGCVEEEKIYNFFSIKLDSFGFI